MREHDAGAATFLTFLAVGMLSARFIMIFKQGNLVGALFGTSSYFLGGVLFLVEVLPAPFRWAAAFLPITHTVKALRELLLAQLEVAAILPTLRNLAIFIALTTSIGIAFFRYAVRRAKRGCSSSSSPASSCRSSRRSISPRGGTSRASRVTSARKRTGGCGTCPRRPRRSRSRR
ncbi:MAG: ABC transporter permease [Planctomycetes bacterium]|nr:ABC transporter permease [Planctomycetota bacterium]NMD34502.1 ABC transporter permease [Planctomycetota bacterium]